MSSTADVRVSGAFYLDDPADGVSQRLLSDLGVHLLRAPSHEGASALRTHLAPAGGEVHTHQPTLLGAELTFDAQVGYLQASGVASCAVDVRDSADAWVRLILRGGDGLVIAAGLSHRVIVVGPAVHLAAPVAEADSTSRSSTTLLPPPIGSEVTAWAPPALLAAAEPSRGLPAPTATARFPSGSPAEAAANQPHFSRPGLGPHTRSVVVDLCTSFYHLGWVTGTGGSISIRHGGRTFMAPSGVQKERMQPQDIFVLDADGATLCAPQPLPGRPRLKLSQCAPLFAHAFTLRGAGACIHTHDISAMLCTLQSGTEFRITHQVRVGAGVLGLLGVAPMGSASVCPKGHALRRLRLSLEECHRLQQP